MKKNLYINDINIGDYGVYISSDTYLNAPLIDYTEFQAPARDGNLILDNKRLNNVIRKFDCYIPDSYDLETGLNSLKKLIYTLRGYLKIVSDYDPDVYQYGYFAEELNVEPFTTKSAQFSLYFSCLPQRWFIENDDITLNSGSSDYTSNYIPSNDPLIQKILANAKNSYVSADGWLFGVTSANALDRLNTTYTFNSTSQTNKQYLIIGGHYIGNEWEYEIIAEIDNYNLIFQYTSSNQYSTYLWYLLPVDYKDVNIETTYTDNDSYTGAMILDESWLVCTENVVDLTAFGSSPVIIYRKYIQEEFEQNGGVVDLFSLNNSIYKLDLNKLLGDYTAYEIINSYALEENELMYLQVMIDFYNCKAYILDTPDSFDANAKLDITKYLVAQYSDISGESIELKYGCLNDDGSNRNFFTNSLSTLKMKTGWWKI